MPRIKTDLIEKLIAKSNKGERYQDTVEIFTRNAERYIKASRQERIICRIESVSKSGMSRKLAFFELAKMHKSPRHTLLNFYSLFTMLGHRKVKDSDSFRIDGCGMDMVFHTHYTNIHQLHSLGFLTKGERDKLAQRTPHIV